VESHIVVVDVVVTDGKGQSVGGLGKKNFSIFEGGVPQTINSFEEHVPGRTAPIKLPEMPPNVFTNFPTTKLADSVNVVLFDSLNTQSRDQSYVRDQLIQYLKTVPPGMQVAIFVLGSRLRMVRGFTTDFSGLSVALDDKKQGVQPLVTRYLPTPSQHTSELTVLGMMMQSRAAPEAIDAFRRFMADETATLSGERVEITLQAFQQLARFLAGIPARKNVIWFAGSFPISFVPDNKRHAFKHQERVQRTSDLLTAGQIAIYPVSAEGIVGNPMFDVSKMEGTPREQFDHTSATQIAMETLAQETGGRAFYNTNGLSGALAEAINTGSHYYTLAYAPSDAKMDGKFRRIQVRVPDGDGYKLAYRRGYYADRPLSEQVRERAAGEDDPLIPLIGFGMPNFDQILYKIAVLPSHPQPAPNAARAGSNTELEAPFVRYRVDFAISPQDLRLTVAPDGSHHGEIEAMLVAYDREGRVLNILRRKSELALEPKLYETVQTTGLQVHEEIDVPQGEVYLRTGIFDLESGSCGSLGIPLRTVGPAKRDAE
jgi:VWFA-related protein